MGVYRGRSKSATVGWEPGEIFSDMVKKEKKGIGKKQDAQGRATINAALHYDEMITFKHLYDSCIE
jgi:hypothetical protein